MRTTMNGLIAAAAGWILLVVIVVIAAATITTTSSGSSWFVSAGRLSELHRPPSARRPGGSAGSGAPVTATIPASTGTIEYKIQQLQQQTKLTPTVVSINETASSSSSHREKKQKAVSSVECGIWLAPSALPGAGLGMYAGRNYDVWEQIQVTGDIVIPIVDIRQHHPRTAREEWSFLWDEYTWSADTVRMENEGVGEVNAASPGFGSAANSFLPLVNIEEWYAENDSAGLHRSKDPGAGAFTYYHNRKSTAKKAIVAGEELYVDYGPEWFTGRRNLGPIPLYQSLQMATLLYRKYVSLKRGVLRDIPEEIVSDIWTTFIENSSFSDDSRVFGGYRHGDASERMALEEGKTLENIRRAQGMRSQEWLARHGTCGDHLRAGKSTLKQAGRGAFSTRYLPEGTVVAPLPMIHVVERDKFIMYNLGDVDPESEEIMPDPERGVLGHQLMLNYCYGHRESSMLLCPYGPMSSFVNHNMTQANVRLQWADPARGNHMPELLEEPLVEQLLSGSGNGTAKLAMELVATRDIAPGEEIFLDYGIEWEMAWKAHVENWSPLPGSESYIAAGQLNKNGSAKLRTVYELHDNPYPDNVELVCEAFFFFDEEWREKDEYQLQEAFDTREGERWSGCEILRISESRGKTLYTAVMYELWSDEDEEYIGYDVRVEDLPRLAFKFVDRPYTTDMFQTNSFRHDIRIGDDIFPKSWRNLI